MSSGDEGFLQDELDEVDEEDDEEEPDEIVVPSGSNPSSPQGGLLSPVAETSEVVQLYEHLEDIKKQLLEPGDKTTISGRVTVNKSGWRKIATAFNLTIETVEEEIWVEDGVVKSKVKAVATAPNGKSATGVGMCASNEANFMEQGAPEGGNPEDHPDYLEIDGKWRRLKDPREVSEHNVYATAATRAKNRAISDCVGGGEVSAEELTADDVL